MSRVSAFIGLATIALVIVAITETANANWAALAGGTSRGAVVILAGVGAAAAVSSRRRERDLTTVHDVIVAVIVAGLAA